MNIATGGSTRRLGHETVNEVEQFAKKQTILLYIKCITFGIGTERYRERYGGSFVRRFTYESKSRKNISAVLFSSPGPEADVTFGVLVVNCTFNFKPFSPIPQC